MAPPLLQHEGVRLQLNTALDMLNAALAAAEAPPPPPPGADDDAMGDLPPPPPPPDDGAPPPPPPPDAPSLSGSRWSTAGAAPVEPDFMVDLSLRESLERLAADREIVFMPTGARQDGNRSSRLAECRSTSTRTRRSCTHGSARRASTPAPRPRRRRE